MNTCQKEDKYEDEKCNPERSGWERVCDGTHLCVRHPPLTLAPLLHFPSRATCHSLDPGLLNKRERKSERERERKSVDVNWVMNSGLCGLGSSIHPYFKSDDEPNTKQQTNPLSLYQSISLSISSSSPSSSIPPTQTLLISLSFLPSPHEWHARQPALLSSALPGESRALLPSFPLLPPPALCFFQRPVTHPGLQKHWWISNLLCASLPASSSLFLQHLAGCDHLLFPSPRTDGEAEETRAGERANCCYSNTLHGEFTRAGVCVATCCCSVTEVHRRAAVFEKWLCLESLRVVLSVYDRMVICGAAL